jgi:hypothetical protein
VGAVSLIDSGSRKGIEKILYEPRTREVYVVERSRVALHELV